MSTKNDGCRACGSTDLQLVLSLGVTPLANSYLTAENLGQNEPRVPLEVFYCAECGLVQLIHVVPAETLFRHYLYVPSASETLRQHFAGLASDLAEVASLQADDLVVEIASNDGLLLKQIQAQGFRTLGVEPAVNIAEQARKEGLDVVSDFFDSHAAARIRQSHGAASAMVGTNVLAHVDGVHDFLAGVESLLDDEGVACFEVPHLLELVENCEFDTIYHEHLSYFSLRALTRLFESAGLTIFKVRRVPIHGGSLRVFAARTGARQPEESVASLLKLEEERGLSNLETYRAFALRVEGVRKDLATLLNGLKADGKRIAGYGAAAKGMTMLAYCDLGPETIDYIADKSPYKQGRYTPGNHIPIYAAERITEDTPDYLLILAWNFGEEIMAQQAAFHSAGGRFILPVPTPTVV